jgi:hypothetical protein
MSEQRATNDSNGGVPAHPTRLLASGIASPMVVAFLLTACGGGGGGGNPVTTGTRRETQSDKLPVRPAETPVEEAPADTERPDTEDKENTQKEEDMSADTQPHREQKGNSDPSLFSPHFDPNIPFDPWSLLVIPKDQFNSDEGLPPREEPPAARNTEDNPAGDDPRNDRPRNDRPDDDPPGENALPRPEFPWRSPHAEEENLSWANIHSEDPFVDPIPRFPTSQRQPGNLISIRIEEGKTDLFPLIAQYARSMPEIFAPELDVPGAFFAGPDAERFYLVHEPANEPEGSPERLVIRFSRPPDYQRPGDADGNNTYEFHLGYFFSTHWGNLSFRVTVDDAPDPVDDRPGPVDRQPDPVDPPPSPIVDDPDPFAHLPDPIIDLPDF